MAESFLLLPLSEQAGIVRAIADRIGRPALLLEKDVWICWILKILFEMPGRKPTVFKGGTSLSKIHRAIDRFSEDIDLTVDYRGLDPDVDPFADMSGGKRDKIREHLELRLAAYLTEVVAPHLLATLAPQFSGPPPQVTVEADGEKVTVAIGSQFGAEGTYLRDVVLLEFGGRNITEPNQRHDVRPYLADHVPDLVFPVAVVDVLTAKRTFWEKATLIHAACNDEGLVAKGVRRLSRHWYDLARLADNAIGARALLDRTLLADVVRVKKVVYRSAKARYDDCLAGACRLAPQGDLAVALRKDHEDMIASGMFETDPPPFQAIVARLQGLEDAVNQAIPPAGA